VALFRGINVGRANRVAMSDLQTQLRALGFTDVQTLLNSGNAIYRSPGSTAATDAIRIRAALAERLHVDAQVIVKTAHQIEEIIADNPLLAIAPDHARLLVVFVQQAAALEPLADLARRDWEPDVLAVTDLAAYLWCGVGILESRVAPLLLKPPRNAGTTRNWATLLKISDALHAAAKKA
jgi:uncharacterized protein (DUF1697 family)